MAVVLAISASALMSCATRVPQVLTPRIVPQAFSGAAAGSPAVWPGRDWWLGFDCPELSQLIQAAQDDNRDLSAASARVMEARSQTLIARSALLPTVAMQAQVQRTGTRASSSAAGSSTAPTSESSLGVSPGGSTSNAFSADIGASYELDVWGLAQANLRAAQESLKSSRFAQQALALSITASVADDYFSVLALRQRIAIANEEVAAINGILDIIKLRVATGASSHLDLAREQAQLESAEGQLPLLKEQELELRLALAVLLGRPPEGFEVMAQGSDDIRVPTVSPGLPSELLLRRPDVAQAEANLASAHANLDAARAAFLPQFSLTGTAGFASAAVGALLHGPSFVWDAGATLVQTVFDGTRLGRERLADATQRELVADYEIAVLNAYADVERALGELSNNANAADHLRREVEAAREAFEIAQLQYRQGVADLLTVLQAQQTLFAARDQLAQTELARVQALVHLFEALGGGWDEPPQDRTQLYR